VRTNTLTNDSLSDMSDDQIIRIVESLKKSARKRGSDGTRSQIELCYAQRELEWRRTRREAHQAYLRRIGARPHRNFRGNTNRKTK